MSNTFDFAPFFRSTVGFDRMLDALQQTMRTADDNYPSYDIERTGPDTYRVTLAVAGFRTDDLNIVAQNDVLVITGDRRRRSQANDNDRQHESEHYQILHRGIAGRTFERRFELADHVKVVGADLSDGLLSVELRREIPEAMRPRRIEIGGANGGQTSQRQIDGERAA